MNSVISVDTAELVKLAVDLSNAADIFGGGASLAVNRVAETTRKNTTLEITSQVNLERDYVDRKVIVSQQATDSKPQAVLEVADEPVSLANFGAHQKSQANVWTAAKYAAAFGSIAAPTRLPSGKIAQWIPRKGDTLRGIQVGSKAAGITASVAKGTKAFRHVFLMPVLSGKVQAGRWGAFSHERGGKKVNAMYGPSVYQVTKGVWRDMYDDIGDELDYEVGQEVSNRIETALGAK